MAEARARVSAIFAAKCLGYDQLRDLQLEVILKFVSGKDVFAILPTGYGKSLCYACLPILMDHLYQPQEKTIVIVVTPLTAIMEDQAS
jgi:ATP-dependent DNA helicase RecQ